jgi:hypothetical protein
MPRRTALIVPVPEAEPAVSRLRWQHDPMAALGVPAHVTVLFPFMPPDAVDEAAVTSLIGRFPAFDFRLDRVVRWPDGGTWLHVEPAGPFRDLTAAVEQRWPEYPPYEGAFDEPIPHLTLSVAPIDLDIDFGLPIVCRAREVVLIEERLADGRWNARLRVPLADQSVA